MTVHGATGRDTIKVPAQVLHWTARLLEGTVEDTYLARPGNVDGDPEEIRRVMLDDAAGARALPALEPLD